MPNAKITDGKGASIDVTARLFLISTGEWRGEISADIRHVKSIEIGTKWDLTLNDGRKGRIIFLALEYAFHPMALTAAANGFGELPPISAFMPSQDAKSILSRLRGAGFAISEDCIDGRIEMQAIELTNQKNRHVARSEGISPESHLHAAMGLEQLLAAGK